MPCHLKPSQTFTDAQLRASCQAVSPPGTATSPPTTTRLSSGWCGLHNAPPGTNYLPSRTATAPDVIGKPKRSLRTPSTRATACSPRYHPEDKVNTGASKVHQSWDRETEKQLLSQGHQTVKQPSLTQRGCCLHTASKSLATLINGSLVTLIMPL